jgi:hypothetical protein
MEINHCLSGSYKLRNTANKRECQVRYLRLGTYILVFLLLNVTVYGQLKLPFGIKPGMTFRQIDRLLLERNLKHSFGNFKTTTGMYRYELPKGFSLGEVFFDRCDVAMTSGTWSYISLRAFYGSQDAQSQKDRLQSVHEFIVRKYNVQPFYLRKPSFGRELMDKTYSSFEDSTALVNIMSYYEGGFFSIEIDYFDINAIKLDREQQKKRKAEIEIESKESLD